MKPLLDKDGNELTEKRIREILEEKWPNHDMGGITDLGGGWFKISAGGSTKPGERNISMITNRAGVEAFNKALKDHFNEKKRDIQETPGAE